jgi:hypothetical protein
MPSTRQIRTWLAAWDLTAPIQVHRAAGGLTSHVWHVEADGRHYIAKLAYQPRDDVENGLRVAVILSHHGLRTGPARHTRAGDLSSRSSIRQPGTTPWRCSNMSTAMRSTGTLPRPFQLRVRRSAPCTAYSWPTGH